MNSPSYHHLAQTYDDLFPLDSDALALLESALGNLTGRRFVDAGCGTGLLARALGDRGSVVHGFDLDPHLLERARSRQNSTVTFSLGDLRTWELPPGFGRPDAVICFGNTLPHLTQASELEEFLNRTARHLLPRGRLFLQLLDYDYLSAAGTLTLPAKRVGDQVFERWYEVQSTGLWTFHTRLEGSHGIAENSFDLCPWRRSDLEAALGLSGFTVDGVFGGFDRRPPGASLPLVLLARLA